MSERIRFRLARLRELLVARPELQEWEVQLGDDERARAVAYPALVPELRAGQLVLLNATAGALQLGTGGVHFIIAPVGVDPAAGDDPAHPASEASPFPGRQAGHLLKLRYSPLQHRVLAVEDPESPHRTAMDAFVSLAGMPVLCSPLLSQSAAAAVAVHAVDPNLVQAWVMLDSAALPAGFSDVVAGLREQGLVSTVITCGQAFGGDLEAVNVYTALIAAQAVAGADIVHVSQGPGNTGTGSRYGFSGMAVLEALHAADALGGQPVIVPRMSFSDPRERHRGLSHHTRTLLELVRCDVELLLPPLAADQASVVCRQLGIEDASDWDPTGDPALEGCMEAIAAFRPPLTTMGRGVREDRVFFLAAATAGLHAAELAGQPEGTAAGGPAGNARCRGPHEEAG